MADIARPATCQACGRKLPVQAGKGRPRCYCDARCRDAARRARARSGRDERKIVKPLLTENIRQEYVYSVNDLPDPADPVAAKVRDAVHRLMQELAGPGAGSPLDVVAAARELSAAAAEALQTGVDRARAAGHSWREIGDVLETTRQAAFQRFGHPIDPRTGSPMNRQTLPGAADQAVEILGCIIEGHWADARRDFGERMLEVVDADRIASAWAQAVGEIGAYERMGEPLPHQSGDATVVEIPLFFEAGNRTGQVTFDQAGKVIGLFLLPAPG